MKKILSLVSLLFLSAATMEKPKKPPRVIALGEIRIQGDVDRPTVSFVIPRAPLNFSNGSSFFEKKNLLRTMTQAIK